MDVADVIDRVLRIGPSLCDARGLGRQFPPIQAQVLRNCGGIMRGLQRRVGGAKGHQSILLSFPPESFWSRVCYVLVWNPHLGHSRHMTMRYLHLGPTLRRLYSCIGKGAFMRRLFLAPYITVCGAGVPNLRLTRSLFVFMWNTTLASSGSVRLRRREDET